LSGPYGFNILRRIFTNLFNQNNELNLLALAVVLAFSSCKKDEKDEPTPKTVTNAKITLNSANGPVEGITVYVYDEDKWEIMGDSPNMATGQAASDENGVARFSNLEYPTVFNQINNNQNTMRFSAHYSLNGVNKTKVKAITFSKGDSKSSSLYLD